MHYFQWELFRYNLQLKKPLKILGDELKVRKGLIIRLYPRFSGSSSVEEFGEGEIVTLPGMPEESLSIAEKQIRDFFSSKKSYRHIHLRNLYPSVRFGLDMAQRTLFNNLNNFSFNQNFDEIFDSCNFYKEKCINLLKIPVNGLAIGTGLKLENECKKLQEEGFKTIKLKVGNLSVLEDLNRVKLTRKILGDKIFLRLDANRSWEWDEALDFLTKVREYDIEFCEEPLREFNKIEKLFEKTGIPLALDETLWKNPDPKTLPKTGVRALVLKPSVLGGWDETKFWIDYGRKNDMKVVLSSSFESGLGLNWIAFIAANLVKNQFASGLDTMKWFQHDIIDPPFILNNGSYFFRDSWPKVKDNHITRIESGAWQKSS